MTTSEESRLLLDRDKMTRRRVELLESLVPWQTKRGADLEIDELEETLHQSQSLLPRHHCWWTVQDD